MMKIIDWLYRHEWKIELTAMACLLLLAAAGFGIVNGMCTANNEVSASKIAVIEGCSLYRVRDDYRRTVYVTICLNGAEQASWLENCGKGCQRQVTSDTVYRGKVDDAS